MRFKRLLYILLFLTATSFAKDIVYHVPIQADIDLGLPAFIERAIRQAELEGASAIIFDIDTFGGRVDGATQIKDAILGSKVMTVAFINRRAISAGALISLSCDKIIMTGGGTIGAATAVDLSGKKASEKVISYMREEMASTAEQQGRNIAIVMGMVDEDLSFETVVIDGDTIEVDDIQGAKEGKLVTLTTEKALKYKIADDKAETFEEVLEVLGFEDPQIVYMGVNWSEKLVRFLTNPVVSSLLMTLGFLGLLFELQSPGWGIPGTIGFVCLALFFGATLFTNLASMTELLIILGGVVLVIIEVFFLPGFGVVGILGGIVLFSGLFMLLLPEHPISQDWESAFWGLTIGIIGAIVAFVLLGKLVVKSKFWQKISLSSTERSSEGYSTSIGLENLIGQEGVAVSDLRPSGWVLVGEKKIFVVSEGEFVPDDNRVKVLSVDGNRVVVRKIS